MGGHVGGLSCRVLPLLHHLWQVSDMAAHCISAKGLALQCFAAYVYTSLLYHKVQHKASPKPLADALDGPLALWLHINPALKLSCSKDHH